jgi:outer membrane translocation and assembly module TamA
VIGTPAASDHAVPFYLLPSLGGKNTLRGFPDYRFHDRAMDVFNVESRWAVMPHVDLAAFVDAGHVAPRLSDLWGSDLKASVGAGVRVHNVRSTLGRLDIARSSEGWYLIFKLTEMFKRATPDSGRTALIPFVP